jgi:transposase-like protein
VAALSLLQARRDWTSTELATRLGVTKDRVAPQARRERAAELSAQGRSQAEVARQLDVSRQSASRWHARWPGRPGAELAGPGRWGRPSRLSEADWRRVENALLAGAVAQGFDTERRSPAGGRSLQGFPCECHLFHEAVALSARWLRDGRPGCSRSRHRASTLSQPKPSAILNRWTSP